MQNTCVYQIMQRTNFLNIIKPGKISKKINALKKKNYWILSKIKMKLKILTFPSKF